MKLEHLRAFMAVVEAGELAEAGEQMGRTPAALSMTLKQIEGELGGPLFDGERKTRLSPLGHYVYAQALRAVAEFDSAVVDIRLFATGSMGVAKVAAVPSAATTLLPLAIRRMRVRHPQMRVDLRDIDSTTVAEAVAAGAVDFGIATLPATRHGLQATPLLQDPFVLVCPARHRLAALGRAVDWDDIDASEFIANGLCARFGAPAVQALVDGSLLTVRNTTSLLTYVKQGFGVTLLPAMAVSATEGLIFLPLKDRSAKRSLELLTRQGQSLSPASQALLEMVQDVATQTIKEGWPGQQGR